MANPNVDKLNSIYSNLTERFYDRCQDVLEGVRSGDLKATDLGASAVEGTLDWIEGVTAPWLLLFDGELKYKPVLRVLRFKVDSGKGDQPVRTKIRIGTGVALGVQHLIKVDDSTKQIANTHVDAKKTTTAPKDRLIVTLKNLSAVPAGTPAGIYDGDIVDTAAGNKPIVKIVVEWPG